MSDILKFIINKDSGYDLAIIGVDFDLTGDKPMEFVNDIAEAYELDKLVETTSTFKWRKSTEEKPIERLWGESLEVCGLDSERNRYLAVYSYKEGKWKWKGRLDPVLWHYLPHRPPIEKVTP